MCKKSTTILQSYLTELLSVSNDLSADKFDNAELVVKVSRRLPRTKKKRVGKDQRCSLLKRLLSKITQDQLIHDMYVNGMVKLCERIIPDKITETNQTCKTRGLRDLLDFTHNFRFEHKLKGRISNSVDLTPLQELQKFTQTFFYDHFADYRDVILHIRDNVDLETSEDESMFEDCPEEPPSRFKEEIEVVNHNINIKVEPDFIEESEDCDDYAIPASLVQACYDDEVNIKEEPASLENSPIAGLQTMMTSFPKPESLLHKRLTEPLKFSPELHRRLTEPPPCPSELRRRLCEPNQPLTALRLITQFPYQVDFRKQRTISPSSMKCRTRGNPFINPQLKKQFQQRNFRCNTCQRRFKSPGYLNAHCSRLMH